jgi:Na+-driven multidrug efflux pump
MCLAAGALLNVALDPWFIYGGFGLPALGLAGVAWATILVQALTFLYMLTRSVRMGILARDSWAMLLPQPRVYAALFKQGAPAALNHLTIALGIFVITYYVSRFGDAAVAAYGIATRIEQVVLAARAGPHLGHPGHGRTEQRGRVAGRVREVWHAALREGCTVMAVGGLLLLLFAETAMRWFTRDPVVLAAGVPYLRIAALISFAYVFLFITTSLLQAVRQPLYAIWIGLYRQVAAPAGGLSAAGRLVRPGGLWFGIGVVTWSAGLFTLWWAQRKLSSKVVPVGKT